jgi:FlaA1/EpsC-like NDP-sugar epimerase
VDVEVVYTGLRPGEKLAEELLTEEEEQSHAVRDRIRIARSNELPGDLPLRLAELRRRAEEGDAEGIRRSLRALVPTYRPAHAPALPRPRRAPEVVQPAEPARAPLGAAGVSPSPA